MSINRLVHRTIRLNLESGSRACLTPGWGGRNAIMLRRQSYCRARVSGIPVHWHPVIGGVRDEMRPRALPLWLSTRNEFPKRQASRSCCIDVGSVIVPTWLGKGLSCRRIPRRSGNGPFGSSKSAVGANDPGRQQALAGLFSMQRPPATKLETHRYRVSRVRAGTTAQPVLLREIRI